MINFRFIWFLFNLTQCNIILISWLLNRLEWLRRQKTRIGLFNWNIYRKLEKLLISRTKIEKIFWKNTLICPVVQDEQSWHQRHRWRSQYRRRRRRRRGWRRQIASLSFFLMIQNWWWSSASARLYWKGETDMEDFFPHPQCAPLAPPVVRQSYYACQSLILW